MSPNPDDLAILLEHSLDVTEQDLEEVALSLGIHFARSISRTVSVQSEA